MSILDALWRRRLTGREQAELERRVMRPEAEVVQLGTINYPSARPVAPRSTSSPASTPRRSTNQPANRSSTSSQSPKSEAKTGSSAKSAKSTDPAQSKSSDKKPDKDKDKKKKKKTDWIGIELKDTAGKPVASVKYKVKLSDGSTKEGTLDDSGKAKIEDIEPGTCKISFPDIHDDEVKKA